jgi:hypothetical protein
MHFHKVFCAYGALSPARALFGWMQVLVLAKKSLQFLATADLFLVGCLFTQREYHR